MGVQNDITCTRPSAGNPPLHRPGVSRTCVDFFFESNSRSTLCGLRSTFCIAQTDLVICFIHSICCIYFIRFNDKHIYSEAARDQIVCRMDFRLLTSSRFFNCYLLSDIFSLKCEQDVKFRKKQINYMSLLVKKCLCFCCYIGHLLQLSYSLIQFITVFYFISLHL